MECTVSKHVMEFESKHKSLLGLPEQAESSNAAEVRAEVSAERKKKKKVNYRYLPQSKKLFLGGLLEELTEDKLYDQFAKFGTITDHVIIPDQVSKKPRGFGFVSFESDEAVAAVLRDRFYTIKGKPVEVTRATPKEAAPAFIAAVPVPTCRPYIHENVEYYYGNYYYYLYPNCPCGASIGTPHDCPLAARLYCGVGTPIFFPAHHP